MRNPKLVPYETIVRATSGEPEAIDEVFAELSADYEAEQKELKEKAAALQSELSKTLEATANAEKFMKVVRKYTSFEELTLLLREFVEKIVIHESEALDGKRRGKLRRQESKSITLCRQGRAARPKARPVRQSAGQGTAKFFTLLLLLYLT